MVFVDIMVELELVEADAVMDVGVELEATGLLEGLVVLVVMTLAESDVVFGGATFSEKVPMLPMLFPSPA